MSREEDGCKGCNALNVQKYAARHPEKQREIKRNQKRNERARKRVEVSPQPTAAAGREAAAFFEVSQ